MTAPVTTDLGPSWLASTPDGAGVLRRTVTECTVIALFDGYFSARVGTERRRPFDTVLVADDDLPLLTVGARFWWVAERTAPGEVVSAIRFRRPGLTAEQAFRRTQAGAR